MELTNPEREMIASTLIAYRAAKMPVSAMQQAFDEIDAVLVKRKPLASIPEQGADLRLVLEAVTLFCDVEQTNKISGYVLEKRSIMGTSGVDSAG